MAEAEFFLRTNHKYNFVTQVAAVLVRQEIEMYLGSALAVQKDLSVDWSDNLKRDAAGFDEYSFRNQKRKNWLQCHCNAFPSVKVRSSLMRNETRYMEGQ